MHNMQSVQSIVLLLLLLPLIVSYAALNSVHPLYIHVRLFSLRCISKLFNILHDYNIIRSRKDPERKPNLTFSNSFDRSHTQTPKEKWNVFDCLVYLCLTIKFICNGLWNLERITESKNLIIRAVSKHIIKCVARNDNARYYGAKRRAHVL